MPVKQMIHDPPSPIAQKMERLIAKEWKNPRSRAAQPIILEEKGGAPHTLHVYVICDDWHGLGTAERAQAIANAFETAFAGNRTEYITLALGLTPLEAERLGIRYR